MYEPVSIYHTLHILLSKNQHGFSDSIRKQKKNGKLTGAVYVDLSKAFDTIGHSVVYKNCQLME